MCGTQRHGQKDVQKHEYAGGNNVKMRQMIEWENERRYNEMKSKLIKKGAKKKKQQHSERKGQRERESFCHCEKKWKKNIQMERQISL